MSRISTDGTEQKGFNIGPVEGSIGSNVYGLSLFSSSHHHSKVSIILVCEFAAPRHCKSYGHGFVFDLGGRLKLQDRAPFKIDTKTLAPWKTHYGFNGLILINDDLLFPQRLDFRFILSVPVPVPVPVYV